mgnify:CR=1 FL=1
MLAQTASAAIKANLTRVAVELLEPIRALFKVPVQVNSGYRCAELNAAVGGSATSRAPARSVRGSSTTNSSPP